MISVTLPLRLVSEANAHAHWRARQRRAKYQHNVVALLLARPLRGMAPPCVVTITRIAPHALDSDNAVGSAKHVRDAVAKCLGVDDREPCIEWIVKQRKGCVREYAVCIEIEPREA